MIKELNKALK